jgi:hypothetical protein
MARARRSKAHCGERTDRTAIMRKDVEPTLALGAIAPLEGRPMCCLGTTGGARSTCAGEAPFLP